MPGKGLSRPPLLNRPLNMPPTWMTSPAIGWGFDCDEPFRAHAAEVRADVRAGAAFGVEHTRTVRSTPEDDPVPGRAATHFAPSDRQQVEIR